MINKLNEMEQYAKKNNVPIIEKEGLVILEQIIINHKPEKVLEIGTAIGYSALKMYACHQCKIVSIERDEIRYNKAIEYIGEYSDIELILGDALLIDNDNFGLFDLIYVDAAKAQNIKFIEKYKMNLSENGLFIIDNLFFHGLVFEEESTIKSNNVRQLVTKIKKFLDYAKNSDDFDFEIIKQGDGIGILRRKNV